MLSRLYCWVEAEPAAKALLGGGRLRGTFQLKRIECILAEHSLKPRIA